MCFQPDTDDGEGDAQDRATGHDEQEARKAERGPREGDAFERTGSARIFRVEAGNEGGEFLAGHGGEMLVRARCTMARGGSLTTARRRAREAYSAAWSGKRCASMVRESALRWGNTAAVCNSASAGAVFSPRR